VAPPKSTGVTHPPTTECRPARPARGRALLALAAIVAAAVVTRVPFLANATLNFTADEAVDALVLRRLLDGEPTLFNWQAPYYGIVESLLALPFVGLLGHQALAFKLAAVSGFLTLLGAVYWLGARLFGRAEGLLAAALLVGFSPALLYWSTLAAGGYCLVIAWGTASLLLYDRLRERPTPRGLALLGFVLGFGLYIYELFLVYVGLLTTLAVVEAAGRQRPTLAPPVGGAPVASLARRGGALLLGLLVGLSPKLAVLFTAAGAYKLPSYGLGSREQILGNLRLLGVCAAEILGLPRPPAPGQTWLEVAVASLYAGAWAWFLWRAVKGNLSPGGLGLVLLVPLTALAFVASPNPRDFASNRYLLPWLTSLPLLAAAALVRLGRRRLGAAMGLAAVLLLYPLWPIVSFYRSAGQLDSSGRPIVHAEPLLDVIGFLRKEGFEGAYADYWESYKGTFLSGERPILAPFDDWDRYPPYTEHVNGLDRVAYVFRTDRGIPDPGRADRVRQSLERFHNRLATAGASPTVVEVGPYLVFHGPGGARLLPPSMPGHTAPLLRPCAQLELVAPPSEAVAGQRLELRVRAANCSDASWSATGLPLAAGSMRVAAVYRWFDLEGRSLQENPERSLLPGDVAPGEAVELIVRAPAPATPGSYELAATLVQENVAFFDLATGSLSVKARVEVREADAVAPPRHPFPPVSSSSGAAQPHGDS
jgi:hypothetical protein